MSYTTLDVASLTNNINQQNELLNLQNQLLDEIVKSDKESQVLLNDLCHYAEGLVPDALASIMLFKPSSNHLYVSAAPSAPQSVFDDLNNLQPSLTSGSCGHAVFTKNQPMFAIHGWMIAGVMQKALPINIKLPPAGLNPFLIKTIRL